MAKPTSTKQVPAAQEINWTGVPAERVAYPEGDATDRRVDASSVATVAILG